MEEYTEFQLLFFKRIGIKPKLITSVNDINEIILLCSKVFTFENLDIITKEFKKIVDKESIKNQILINGSGGLCYKLNGLLYYFLKDCGINIYMSRGHVLNPRTHKSWSKDQTHIINIINIDGNLYVADIAFGCFIALELIPIKQTDAPTVVVNSITGLYKIEKKQNKVGNFNYNWCLEYKRYDTFQGVDEIDKQWNIVYAFNLIDNNTNNNSDTYISQQLSDIQNLIINEKNGEFNERLLSTKVQDDTILTLTYGSLTKTNCKDGSKSKIEFSNGDEFNQFNYYLLNLFNIKPILKDPYI